MLSQNIISHIKYRRNFRDNLMMMCRVSQLFQNHPHGSVTRQFHGNELVMKFSRHITLHDDDNSNI